MKKILFGALALALLASGCKVFKSSKKTSETAVPAAQTETAAEPKVFSVPAPKPATRENPASDNMYQQTSTGKPVSMRSENFTFSAEDQAAYGNKSYFIIVGSFSSNENAGRFKQELSQQGFRPIILHSETGYYRVCVDSFNDEAAARNRVQQIRNDFPKYSDAWLLIKK